MVIEILVQEYKFRYISFKYACPFLAFVGPRMLKSIAKVCYKSWIGKKEFVNALAYTLYSLSKVWLIRRENKHGYPKKENERMFWRKSFFLLLTPFCFIVHKWCPTFRGHFSFPFPPNSRFFGVILDHPCPLKIGHHLWMFPWVFWVLSSPI